MAVGEIIDRARAAGLQGVAITDHDCWYRPEAQGPEDLLVISGEEFSTEFGHLLGLFLTGPIPFARVPGRALEAPGGVGALIDAIHAQGGLAVLAHPFERELDETRLLPLVPLLDGLEVWNGRANRIHRDANARAAAFARDHGLAPLAGSDAHLPREIGNGVLRLEVEALTPEAVKAALRRGTGRASGREGRSLDTARSQHTKLNRTHAGPLRRLKWLVFAGKCAVEDLLRGPLGGTGETAPSDSEER
jgi:hypothetical protein